MTRRTTIMLAMLSVCASAATLNTTLTVSAAANLATSTATGTANLSSIGSATFSGSIGSIGATTVTAPFTITLSDGTGTISGTLTFPLELLIGGATTGTASATITGGTGTYAGATGSFPTLAGTVSGGLLNPTLSFTGAGTIVTSGGGPGGSTLPSITAVWNAASNTPTLAPGSIFIVKGSNLCPSGTRFYNVPRPTVSSDGVKITLTSSGGASTDALIWYTYNPSGTCQLAAILPSSVAPGGYNVTVTNGSASAPFATTVAVAKPGLFTQDSTGTGLASVQNYISPTVVDLNSFTTGLGKSTTISPARPGQVLQVYATGLGGVAGQDNASSPFYNFAANGVTVRAIVGDRSIPVDFAGRAGYPGQDQINVTLPADVATGCTVPFQISVNGVLSNTTFIAIAPSSGANACVAPGFTTAQLQRLDQGGTVSLATFGLAQITQTTAVGTVKSNSAVGNFSRYSGFQLAAGSGELSGFATPGSCQVTQSSSSQDGSSSPSVNFDYLDAGAITLNGPAASGIANRVFRRDVTIDPVTGKSAIFYSLTLATEGVPGGPTDPGTFVAGSYALTGAGGKDVGQFNTSITLGAPIAVTGGLPTSVNRGTGLTINWTGAKATDIVEITGSATTTTASGVNTSSFVCFSTADKGNFTVPASILSQLPATTAVGSGGILQVFSTSVPTEGNGLFTAPLTAGGSIDIGFVSSTFGVGGSVSYQ